MELRRAAAPRNLARSTGSSPSTRIVDLHDAARLRYVSLLPASSDAGSPRSALDEIPRTALRLWPQQPDVRAWADRPGQRLVRPYTAPPHRLFWNSIKWSVPSVAISTCSSARAHGLCPTNGISALPADFLRHELFACIQPVSSRCHDPMATLPRPRRVGNTLTG